MKKHKDYINPDADNLQNIDETLYNIIDTYSIGHNYLASNLYPQDWDDSESEKGKATRKMLTGRLRNKLDGNGKLTTAEYTDLINVLSEMASTTENAVKQAIAKRNKLRREKIERFLEEADEETRKELKKML